MDFLFILSVFHLDYLFILSVFHGLLVYPFSCSLISCLFFSELDLDSCKRVYPNGLVHIMALSKLQRLNLYRTSIDQETMSMIAM